MGASVKLGTPLKKKSFFIKIKNYINNKKYKLTLGVAAIIHDYMLRDKFLQLISWIVNVVITGTLIYYIMNNNNFIAYGLTVILGIYYLDMVVQIIKKPYEK